MALSAKEVSYLALIQGMHENGAGRPVCKSRIGDGRCSFIGTTPPSLRTDPDSCRADNCAACESECTAYKIDLKALRKWMALDNPQL